MHNGLFGKFTHRTNKRKLASQLHPVKLISCGHCHKILNNLLLFVRPKSLKQFANMNTAGALGGRVV